MDVAPRGVATGAAHMNLVVEVGQKLLGVFVGTARAHKPGAPGSTARHGQKLGRGFAVSGGRRIHLHEIGTQAHGRAGSARDQVGSLLLFHRRAARIDPQHHEQTLGVRLGDQLACLGKHLVLELAAQIHRISQPDDVDAGLAHGQDRLEVVQLRGVRVLLVGLHQVGLGIHLHEVVHLRIVGGILRNQTALAGHNAADALVGNLEQMLGVAVVGRDALAHEILVQMLHLLVAGKEHETACALRGGHHVVDIGLASLRHDVGRDAHIFAGNRGHRGNPFIRFLHRAAALLAGSCSRSETYNGLL